MFDLNSIDLATLRKVAGIIAAVVSFIAHPLYIWAVVAKKETKPHFFYWLISAFIAGVSLLLFDKAEGGDPIYMLIGDFIGFVIIAIVALFFGNGGGKKRDGVDWACLIGAFVGIGIYVVFRNALIALSAVLLAEALGAALVARKTYLNPEQEDFLAWLFTCAGNVMNVLAASWSNTADIAYVATILVIDGAIMGLIVRGKFFKRC